MANSIKELYKKASTNYSMTHDQIASGKMAWAMQTGHSEKLETAWKELNNNMGDLANEYVRAKDMTPLKRKYSEEKIIAELDEFANKKPKIEAVIALAEKIALADEQLRT